jgi:subtilisin family serine protease
MKKPSKPWILLCLMFILQAQMPTGTNPEAKIGQALRDALPTVARSGEALPVWVYFRDKGEAGQASIRKALGEAKRTLQARCLWRRSKVRSDAGLVDYEDLPLFPPYTAQVKSLNVKVRAVSRWLNAVSVEAYPEQIQALAGLDCVKALGIVKSFKREDGSSDAAAVPQSAAEPKNPLYGFSYTQLNQINVPALHQQGLSGRGVLVCLLDIGFRKSHEVFRLAHIVAQWDFVNGDGDVAQNPSDPNDYTDDHGTATWSLLGGFKVGGLMGPAFGADFILGKTETSNYEKPIEEDWWAAGIEWAESLGAEVVSSSLGYTDWYQFKDMDGKTAVTTRAANRATSLGVVVVNAAGNERGNAWGHIIAPSDGSDVIAAGAVDSTGKLASFSSPGPTYDGRIKPEVCALGVSNWVAANRKDQSDYYVRGSGTSYATPLVAGVVALLLEAHRNWTPKQVRAALMDTAGNASAPNNNYGWGIVNAAAAVNYSPAIPTIKR